VCSISQRTERTLWLTLLSLPDNYWLVMKRYENIIKSYHEDMKQIHSLMTKLTMNIKGDLEGLFTERTQFSNRLYDLLGSVQYRQNAVEWHLRNLCTQHSQFEQNLYKSAFADSSWYKYDTLNYLFDDFVFNLISLYDYFGSFLYVSFVDPQKPKKMWSRLANAAGNKNNEFSNCLLAKEIFQHHREWVIKLNQYRAEVIHYNLKQGNAKKKISIDNVKGTMKAELQVSLPEDLVKLLSLEECKQNENGVDMQFGAIEIVKRSTKGIKKLTQTALTKCTTNSIKFSN
jgi:hypothetical protein